MIIRARGIKAWLWILGVLLLAIVVLVILFNLFVLLLPIIIIIALLSYFFRMLNKVKKEPSKDYVDVKFKIR